MASDDPDGDGGGQVASWNAVNGVATETAWRRRYWSSSHGAGARRARTFFVTSQLFLPSCRVRTKPICSNNDAVALYKNELETFRP